MIPQSLSKLPRKLTLFSLSIFLCLVAVGGWSCSAINPTSQETESPTPSASPSEMFMGIQHASPTQIAQAFPGTVGKPLLVDFSSKYCLDCQRMKPILASLLPKYQHIQFKHIDIMRDKATNPAPINLFKPTTVPVLVFISPKSKIVNVVYDYHPSKELAPLLAKLDTM